MRRQTLRLPFLEKAGACGRCGDILDVRHCTLSTGRHQWRDDRWWFEVLDGVPLCAGCAALGYDVPPPGKRKGWERFGIVTDWMN